MTGSLYGQSDSTTVVTKKDSVKYIQIYGRVKDTIRGDETFQLMVINKSKGIGHTGNWDGSFSLKCKQSDTLLIAAGGYKVVTLTFKDSVFKPNYQVILYVEPLSIELSSVEITPMKTVQELKRERQNLEREDVRELKDPLSMAMSPITALYQYFSQRERSKRLVAEMEYEDKKREFLKELFRVYVDYDVIALEGREFDEFIDYLNISDEMLRYSAEIELIEYIQHRYKQFRREFDYYFTE